MKEGRVCHLVNLWVLTFAIPALAQETNEAPQSQPLADPQEAALAEESLESTASGSKNTRAEIVITGYRRSLGAALAQKQRATAPVDAIVADDIADFPDLNLAESLQRIPGVAITRTNGEGARITVRGLSGLYTRTRVNGMDTRVGIGDNTSRDFDFNLFASELFNSIVVHKTATAELGDGSLGAVVDLNTGRPFNYKKGLTVVASAQGNYNDLSETLRPRMAGLLSYRDPGGIWGITASAAYSRTRNDEAVHETVRWQQSRFNSVNGNACFNPPVPPATAKTPSTDPGCKEVADAFHVRMPRYADVTTTSERLGLTAGIQIRPLDGTDIRLEGLHARYDRQYDLRALELLFRSNEGRIDVTNYDRQILPDRFGVVNNTLSYMEVKNAPVRSETIREISEADFYQLTLAIDHEFTQSIWVNILAGTSRSQGRVPHATSMMYDIPSYESYSYDYRQGTQYPQLVFSGADVEDARSYSLTEVRDRINATKNIFDTLDFKLSWEVAKPLKVSTGANYKRMSHNTERKSRDGTVCGLKLYDCDPDKDPSTPALIGAPGRPELSDQIEYAGKVGDGSRTRWAAASVDKWVEALGYYNLDPANDYGGIRTVVEQTLGTFLQLDGEVGLGMGGMRLMYNAGVQYVQTRQESTGYRATEFIEYKRPMYDDWLPSVNTALWLTDALVLRLAGAQTMARPGLGDLTPGVEVNSFNYVVSFKNPDLDPTRALGFDVGTEWYFAKESILSLGLFWKKISSFPLPVSKRGTFAGTELPRSVISPTSPADTNLEGTCTYAEGCWEINDLTNGTGATVKGLEVGFQAPFSTFYSGLPPVIRGLGFAGNFTLVDSQATYNFSGNKVKERLLGLSNHSFNATLYYEDPKFGARVSVANRGGYLEDGANVNGNLWQYVESSTRVDFASSYNITQGLEVSFEALNLTDTPYDSKVDVDAERRLQYRKTGRNFLLGARYTY
jgi:TonB-dependent receptor